MVLPDPLQLETKLLLLSISVLLNDFARQLYWTLSVVRGMFCIHCVLKAVLLCSCLHIISYHFTDILLQWVHLSLLLKKSSGSEWCHRILTPPPTLKKLFVFEWYQSSSLTLESHVILNRPSVVQNHFVSMQIQVKMFPTDYFNSLYIYICNAEKSVHPSLT